MTTTADVRAAIKVQMEAVQGMGLVHAFERYAAQASTLQAQYVTAGQLHGWFVRRAARAEKPASVRSYLVTERWEMRGYMALDDAAQTELAFDDLIERLADAFRVNDNLGGVVNTCTTPQQSGIQLLDSGPVMFCGVLCHSARLGLTTIYYR